MWPSALSGRLLIVGLVGRHPANYLIRRGPIVYRLECSRLSALCHAALCAYAVLAAVSGCYPPVHGRLSTRYSPVRHSAAWPSHRNVPSRRSVRLACVRHAASVHPEPGSNSLSIYACRHLCLCVSLSHLLSRVVLQKSSYKDFQELIYSVLISLRYPQRYHRHKCMSLCFAVQLSMCILSL